MVEVFPRGWTGLSFSVPFPLTGSGPTRPVGLCWGSAPSLGILLRGGAGGAPPPGGGAATLSTLTYCTATCLYLHRTYFHCTVHRARATSACGGSCCIHAGPLGLLTPLGALPLLTTQEAIGARF